MEQIPEKTIHIICSLCNSAKLDEIKRVDAKEFSKEIKERKKAGFAGVLRLNFRKDKMLNSCYIIFMNGDIIFTMKEVVSPTEGSTFYNIQEPELCEGALEIIEIEKDALRKVADKIPENTLTSESATTHERSTVTEEPEDVSSSEPEKLSSEILKFKERIQHDAEKSADKIIEDMKPKINEKELRAVKLPRQKCNKILGVIESELGGILGEIKAKNLIRLRLTEMKFNDEKATCAIVADMIEYLRKTALKNKLGKAKADGIADKMLWKVAEVIDE